MENIPDIGARAMPIGRQARWKRFFIFSGAFVLIMALGAGAFFGVRYYRYRQGYLLPMERYEAYMDIFRNDTYGGQTPEETLQLFVAALRAGDVEKASLYFMPDDSGSREKWVTLLKRAKEQGGLDGVVGLVERTSSASRDDRSAIFESRDAAGVVDVSLVLVNNGKIWKIESL